MAFNLFGQHRLRAPQYETPVSADALIDPAVQAALRNQGSVVNQQFELFPGLKSALDLYSGRLSGEAVPQGILDEVAGTFRAENALASPGSTASPALALDRSLRLRSFVEGERQRALGNVQSITSPFILNPLQPSQTLGTYELQEGRRLGQSNMQNQANMDARLFNRAQEQQKVGAIGSLIGAGAAGAAPFVFPSVGKFFGVGQGPNGTTDPRAVGNILRFAGAGAQFGGGFGSLF